MGTHSATPTPMDAKPPQSARDVNSTWDEEGGGWVILPAVAPRVNRRPPLGAPVPPLPLRFSPCARTAGAALSPPNPCIAITPSTLSTTLVKASGSLLMSLTMMMIEMVSATQESFSIAPFSPNAHFRVRMQHPLHWVGRISARPSPSGHPKRSLPLPSATTPRVPCWESTQQSPLGILPFAML